jgi:signal transduction histidine kinase
LQNCDCGQLSKLLRETRSLVEHAIQETRSLTFELSSPVLYDLGFEAALGWLVEKTQKKNKLKIEIQPARKFAIKSEELKTLLYQIARELLHNVIKHARATRAFISLQKKGANIIFSVKDNGRGFKPSSDPEQQKKQSGFGLFSIRERLNHYGGRMEINSAKGQGTQVRIILPNK